MGRGVALVAADAVTALAPTLDGTVQAMLEGRRAVAPIGGFDPAPFGAEAAAVLAGLDAGEAEEGPTHVVTPHGAILERVARAVHGAAGAGGLPREGLGFFVGLGMVDSDPEALAPALAASRDGDGPFDLARFFGGGFRSIHPHWPLAMLNNVAVGQVAADLDLRGDNMVLAAEADAGARAVAEALESIRAGASRAALVAGVSEKVSPAALQRARLRGVPGLVLGEGGGALWLEDEAMAVARGRTVRTRLAGAGFAFGASDRGAGPSEEAVARAVRAALDDAGTRAEDVGVLVVEGTGVGEAAARRSLFGARRAEVAVVAPAMALGHLLAGAPAVAVGIAAAVLVGGRAPSSAGGRPRPVRPGSRALVLASGSAGGAAALVVEGAP